MANFSKTSSEKRVSGRVAVAGSSVVLGRIRFFDESYTEGAILCVRENESIDREMLLLCPPLAIIIFCRETVGDICELCSLGVPCLILNELNNLDELSEIGGVSENKISYDFCKNKVALIDTERGILTVDPSIDTLEFYSSSKNKNGAVDYECATGKILKNAAVNNAEKQTKNQIKNQMAEHYLVSASSFEISKLFDGAVDLWEQTCPELLVFDVSVPKVAEGDERIFCERVEELFRAALYGSFAISLSSFDCESEFSSAMRLFHKTFCMLEAEGREFNGYLPRGIMLSSPLWLMRSSPVTNPDFLIFDLDSLLPSLFSLSCEQIIKKEKALKKELFSVLERYFASFAPRCDIFLKTQYFSNTSLLRDFVRLANVKIVFS